MNPVASSVVRPLIQPYKRFAQAITIVRGDILRVFLFGRWQTRTGIRHRRPLRMKSRAVVEVEV